MTISFPVATRGSTYKHRLTFSGTGSIADCIIRMMVKVKESDSDDDALISIDNEDIGGITIISASTPFEIEVDISDSETATLPVKKLFAGIQLELPNGTTEEIDGLDPAFTVEPDGVRRVAT